MALDLQIINPINYPGWDEMLLSKEEFSFFHSSPWMRVLSESYQYNPLCFVLIKDNDLRVAIPFMEIKSIFTGQRGVSLPFSDYCDPIVSDDVNFHDVFNRIVEYGKKAGWKYIEIRGEKDFLADSLPSAHYCGHFLDLTKINDKSLSKLRNSHKRNIKKAVRDGVTVGVYNTPEAVKEFYRLNCLTRKRHGLPPQPYVFFKKIYEHIINKKLGCVLLASYKGMAISGAMYFHLGGKVICKYVASDKKYLHLKPNNLVLWESIKWHSLNGFKNFSFGRTEPDAKGQIWFKSGWRAEETSIKYYTYDLKKNGFIKRKPNVYGIHNKVFNAMPINLLKMSGTMLYKHMG